MFIIVSGRKKYKKGGERMLTYMILLLLNMELENKSSNKLCKKTISQI